MAAAVVILLALGIGANATMFEIVDRLLLRPPDHLVDAERLRMVYSQRPTLSLPRFARNLTYSDVADLKGLPALEAVAAFTQRRRMTLGTNADARKIQVQLAEAAYFTTLGVQPLLGRFYRQNEDEPGAPLTAVIGAAFWQREMGGDPRVLGRVLSIGKDRYEVVGIAPDGFTGADLSAIDVWLPLRAAMAIESGREALETRTWWWTSAVIRLKPSVTDETANAQMTAALGTAIAAVAGRFIEGLLFNVETGDPLVHGAVVIVLSAAGVAASLGPAWRATSTNPASALQAE